MVRARLFLVVVAVGCDAASALTEPEVDAGSVDGSEDGGTDATMDAGMIDADVPSVVPAVLYEQGRRHSPITSFHVTRLQAIAAAVPHSDQVFAKVGDSITATSGFMACFDGSPDLGDQGGLASTVSYFRTGDAAGSTPFARVSRSAFNGSTAGDVLVPPSRLHQEVDEINPRFSVVMFGTNDVREGISTALFAADLWAVVDALIARGVIPILSTIPALPGDPDAARVPSFNLAIRAIAQGRGTPLVDLFRELDSLPNRGLSGDNVHPSSAPAGACDLTAPSLRYGYNVRNLITIEALARVRAALAGSAADASAPTRPGHGTLSSPFVGTLPLLDLGDTRTGTATFAAFPCNPVPQGGREVVYQIDLATSMTIEVNVIDRAGVDAQVHVLAGSSASEACVASGNPRASAVVGPGPVFIVVDAPSTTTEGEYVLVVERR